MTSSPIEPPFVSRCDSISPESLLRCEKPAGHDDGPEPTAHEARRSEHGTAAWGNEAPSDCPRCHGSGTILVWSGSKRRHRVGGNEEDCSAYFTCPECGGK